MRLDILPRRTRGRRMHSLHLPRSSNPAPLVPSSPRPQRRRDRHTPAGPPPPSCSVEMNRK
ncbi:hypothetical protein E2C01_045882 [Portunus trituberculatus]|uniref:Uncharacterized protein n=1 Tax=Portunus trituberculatus TaxID=210409 RepID=A0A5B7G454_PORTR|nr:hypothetical protein [Portunus trituberculatus]